MRYFSTFSGIGGFELGIEQAYESLCNAYRGPDRGSEKNTQREKGQGLLSTKGENTCTSERSVSEGSTDHTYARPLCVGYSEINEYAAKIYQKHFPTHKNYGDITKIRTEDLPDFDFLVGGFPCQAFSIAGKRMGFEDTRGTLFFELARILQAKQPRRFLFENVKGLLSHDCGRTFKTIIATVNDLGYDCEWQVLNSKNHGVPQNRERVFIIGYLRGTGGPKVFPIRESDEPNGAAIERIGHMAGFRRYNQTYEPSGSVEALDTSGGGGHQPCVIVPEATRGGYAEAHIGDSINLSVMGSKTRCGRVGRGVVQTLDTGMQQHTLTVSGVRRLTPKECERLQGFPDNWTEGISDAQRYKCCGNAVTVNVIRDICAQLLPS